MQEAMYLSHFYRDQDGQDIEQFFFRIDEAIDTDKFCAAWRHVVRRHAALRTQFNFQSDQGPVQEVLDDVALELPICDWRQLSASEQSDQLDDFIQSQRVTSIELDRAPLMRFGLFRTEDAKYRFVWTVHSMVIDGSSAIVVIREVFACYDVLRRGEPIALPAPEPFKDHVLSLQGHQDSASDDYWHQHLDGFRWPIPLVVDGINQNASPEPGTDAEELVLSESSTSQLRCLGREGGFHIGQRGPGRVGCLAGPLQRPRRRRLRSPAVGAEFGRARCPPERRPIRQRGADSAKRCR